MPSGYVVVSGAGSAGRTDLLIDHLTAAHLDVIRDPGLPDAEGWSPMIMLAYGAAATILTLTAEKVEEPAGPAWSARQTGTLLPVRLHPGAIVPADFGDLTPFDLSGWQGGSDPELVRLIESCRRLVARRGYRLQPGERLADESYQLSLARGYSWDIADPLGDRRVRAIAGHDGTDRGAHHDWKSMPHAAASAWIGQMCQRRGQPGGGVRQGTSRCVRQCRDQR